MLRFGKYLPLYALCLIATVFAFSFVAQVSALTGSEWKAGRIIDDPYMYRASDLSVNDIQGFLNTKVGICDTQGTQGPYYDKYGNRWNTRADYGRSAGNPPPYTCLKDYSTTFASRSADSYCQAISGGTKSAATIIYEVSNACDISAKALIVMLEKEQGLVSDDWPWNIQYRGAMGYGCPDTAPCDAEYYGLFNQVYNAARQFKLYAAKPGDYRYKPYQSNFIYWNPSSSCGGSDVYIENKATAGLYNYTPYQPNTAALDRLYGSGDGCSAYGNRNFWRLFNDWFGPTRGVGYAWEEASKALFTDSTRTIGVAESNIKRGQSFYGEIRARNTGTATWKKGVLNQQVNVGTSNPIDRSSKFCDVDWISRTGCGRVATMVENEVAPGSIGTFRFWLTAPVQPGTYSEYFNLVMDGTSWLKDIGFYWKFTVSDEFSRGDADPNDNLSAGIGKMELRRNERLVSPDGNTVLIFKPEGTINLYKNYKQTWSLDPAKGTTLVLQNDGNLVLYTATGAATWASNTNNAVKLILQNDGNLALLNSSGSVVWSSNTATAAQPLWSLQNNDITYRGQFIRSSDRKYTLALQRDGNLVLHSQYRAIWATNTRDGFLLVQQPDGNLVLYNNAGEAIWANGGRQPSTTYIQLDGNMVSYNADGKAIWATNTAGQK